MHSPCNPFIKDQFANAFLHDPNMTLPVMLHKAVSTDSRDPLVWPLSSPFCSQRACFTENQSERIHLIAGRWHALSLVSSSRFLLDTLCHFTLRQWGHVGSIDLLWSVCDVWCCRSDGGVHDQSHGKELQTGLVQVRYNLQFLLTSLPTPLTPRRCLGVVHRMLCYQKRCKIRLNYGWKELWVGRSCTHYHCVSTRVCPFYITAALLNLLKFFAASEEHLLPKFNIFIPAIEVCSSLLYTVTSSHSWWHRW